MAVKLHSKKRLAASLQHTFLWVGAPINPISQLSLLPIFARSMPFLLQLTASSRLVSFPVLDRLLYFISVAVHGFQTPADSVIIQHRLTASLTRRLHLLALSTTIRSTALLSISANAKRLSYLKLKLDPFPAQRTQFAPSRRHRSSEFCSRPTLAARMTHARLKSSLEGAS